MSVRVTGPGGQVKRQQLQSLGRCTKGSWVFGCLGRHGQVHPHTRLSRSSPGSLVKRYGSPLWVSNWTAGRSFLHSLYGLHCSRSRGPWGVILNGLKDRSDEDPSRPTIKRM